MLQLRDLALTFLALATFAVARPGPAISPITSKPECRDVKLYQCISPVISFFFSADGQRITKLRKSGSLMEPDFNKVCRLGQTTTGCIDKWITECMPAEQSDVHILSKGTIQILSICNETDTFTKFNKMTECAEKMNATHTTCGETMRASLSQRFNYQSPAFAVQVFRMQNLQQELCCTIKNYNNCVAPKLDSCSADGKSFTNNFFKKVFEAYKCTQTTFDSCSAVS
jgi:hypothetical protein